MSSQSQRQLAAVMFTDMVGYTALMQQNEQLAIQKRDRSKKIFEDALAKYDGKLLQYYGDGTLSIFSSAVNAIRSAIEMQTLNLQDPKIEVRIGIHIGDVMMDDKGIYGDSVNVASRIESLAVPGSVFISEKIYDDVKNHEGISARALGYFELKNVKQPIQVYAITNTGIVVPSREDVKGKVKETLNSIAVLPFASLSSDPENEFFCDGITEELLNVLARIEGLQVTSRTSSFAFKGKNEDVREIAAKLNVQKILEGSVRKAGNKVRISAQLINASDGYHIWSEAYNRSIEDIFAVQDEISREIANKFRANFNELEHVQPLVKVPTENLEAYKKYLHGLHHWNRQTIQDILRALDLLNEAVRMEPDFANPYAYLSYIYFFLGYAGIMNAEEAAENCRQSAANAVKRDSSNPLSHLAIGISKLAYEWDWNGGLHSLQYALDLNPNLPTVYIWLAWYYLLMLEPEKALAQLENAYHLDPMGGETIASMAEINMLAGKFERAISLSDEALDLDPNNMYAKTIKGMSIGFNGNWNQSVEIISEVINRAPDFALILSCLGIAYAKSGDAEKAGEIIRKMESMEQQRPGANLSHQLSMLYLSMDEMEKFYEFYEKSIQKRMVMSLVFYGSPHMKKINSNDRIRKIRKKIGLPV